MKHGYHGIVGGGIWGDALIIIGLLALVVGLILAIHRQQVKSDGLTFEERKSLDYPECDILSMVRQHGGPMAQNDIIDSIPADLNEVTEAIKRMESIGLIQREWRTDQGTYVLST